MCEVVLKKVSHFLHNMLVMQRTEKGDIIFPKVFVWYILYKIQINRVSIYRYYHEINNFNKVMILNVILYLWNFVRKRAKVISGNLCFTLISINRQYCKWAKILLLNPQVTEASYTVISHESAVREITSPKHKLDRHRYTYTKWSRNQNKILWFITGFTKYLVL